LGAFPALRAGNRAFRGYGPGAPRRGCSSRRAGPAGRHPYNPLRGRLFYKFSGFCGNFGFLRKYFEKKLKKENKFLPGRF
jgi:hypothetical protein